MNCKLDNNHKEENSMRKLILGAILGTCLISSLPTVADASWLSKAWGRLENSLDTVSTDAPASTTTVNGRLQDVGHLLPDEDLKIVGVPLGATVYAIKNSLGTPQYANNEYLQYGGIKFYPDRGIGKYYNDSSIVDRIVVINRDAATSRGIAVGDTLKQVVAVYGQPDYIYKDYHFYGYRQAYTDYIKGIYFHHDGRRVVAIVISS